MSLTARAIYEFMGTGTGQRRAYPKERKRQLSDEWKRRVRDRLAELDKDHRWLEAEIGASRGMVTKMLAPRQNTSSLVDKVCAALSLEPPVTDATPEELRLVQGFRKMTADQRAPPAWAARVDAAQRKLRILRNRRQTRPIGWVMVQGINAAIVRAEREAALSGDSRRVDAVRELVGLATAGDFSSTGGDKFSPSPLLRSASGDIKSPWDAISTD